MNQKERYQKLYDQKLSEFVKTKTQLDKIEHQLNLLRNWLEVEELEAEAKVLT